MNGFSPRKMAALEALLVEIRQATDDLRASLDENDFDATMRALRDFTAAFDQTVQVLREGGSHASLLS